MASEHLPKTDGMFELEVYQEEISRGVVFYDRYDKAAELRIKAAEIGYRLVDSEVFYNQLTAIVEVAGGALASSDDLDLSARAEMFEEVLEDVIKIANGGEIAPF